MRVRLFFLAVIVMLIISIIYLAMPPKPIDEYKDFVVPSGWERVPNTPYLISTKGQAVKINHTITHHYTLQTMTTEELKQLQHALNH